MKVRVTLACAMIFVLAVSLLTTGQTVDAAGKKAVKSVRVRIGKKKVTKKTYTLERGKSKKLKLIVSPKAAVKSVRYQSGNSKIASVSRNGKVTAKKKGTAKIRIIVTGKNRKKKVAWVKMKIVNPAVKENRPEPSNAPSPTAKPGTTAPGVLPTPTANPSVSPAPTEEPGVKPQENDGFVKINGGTYRMGSPLDEPEREADEILHSVTVGDFYMMPTEVTQGEYQTLMGINSGDSSEGSLPMTNVSWYDAVNFCNALSRSTGLKEAYTVNGTSVVWDLSADGYRLPTEAEWEYAARAGSGTAFCFGDYVYDEGANCYNAYGYNNNASGSWVNGYLGHTVEVKSYPTNANGLYNVHGNVSEWVWDWYGEYGTDGANNPVGNESGNYKVARGGAWNDFPKHIRSAYRSANAPDVGTYGIGFRPVRGAVGDGTVSSVFSEVEKKSEKRVLIAYFSQTGNTKGLTDIIAEMTGADVFHIERATDYSSTHNSQGLYAEALDELRNFAVPDLKTSLEAAGYDINDYDTVLLGYCNWWASIPAPVRSFLKTYSMEGKTIIPYCSMGGGHFGQTISAVAKLTPGSNIGNGLDVTYSSYDRDRIGKWLMDAGIPIAD